MKNDIFDKISPNEALKILRQITKADKNLKIRLSNWLRIYSGTLTLKIFVKLFFMH